MLFLTSFFGCVDSILGVFYHCELVDAISLFNGDSLSHTLSLSFSFIVSMMFREKGSSSRSKTKAFSYKCQRHFMETRHCTFCSSCAFIGTILHTPHFLSLCVSFSALPTTWLYWRWIFFLSCHITLGSLYWIIRNRNYEFEIRYYQLLLFSFAAMLLLLLLFEFLYVCIFSYTLYPCCLCHYYTRFNRCRAAHVIKMFQFFFRSLACHRRRCRQWWWWCCCCCLGYCLQLQHLCMIMDFCMTFHFDSFHGTSSVSIFSFFGRFFARYVLLNAPNALDTVAFFFSFLLLLSLDNAYASLWSRTDIVK